MTLEGPTTMGVRLISETTETAVGEKPEEEAEHDHHHGHGH